MLVGWVKELLARLAHRPTGRRLAAFLRKEARRADLAGLVPDGSFRDSSGTEHVLYRGLRDLLKPGWSGSDGAGPGNPEDPAGPATHGLGTAARAEAFLGRFGLGFRGLEVLEIGCGTGAMSFGLVASGAAAVTGTEYAPYQEAQARGGDPLAALAGKREAIGRAAEALSGQPGLRDRVRFLLDDAEASTLESGSFRAIVSWEVLEHVRDPKAFFRTCFRLLAPGGFALHDWNPFFSSIGGHSPCTLDFPWGHARLSTGDFEAYVRKLRPAEAEGAIRFFTRHLNRLGRAEALELAQEAGFRVEVALPRVSEDDLELLPPGALGEVRRLYPRVDLVDLVSPFVVLLLVKPAA